VIWQSQFPRKSARNQPLFRGTVLLCLTLAPAFAAAFGLNPKETVLTASSHPRPWHRGSVFGPGVHAPLDRNGRARFHFLVTAHHRARRITPAGARVAEVLLRHLGTGGQCDPTHATIAAEAICDEKTVGRVTGDLRDVGLIRWQNRLVRNGWRAEQTSNQYELLTTAPTNPAPLPRRHSADFRVVSSDGHSAGEIRSIEIQRPEPTSAEVREAQAALARRRIAFESQLRSNMGNA
jgi:hypothetical protein